MRLGAVGNVDSTTNGTVYFDAYESRRQTYIGPMTGALVVSAISYTYDPLYRLTAADYSDGTYFHYTYDAVGNRLTEVTPGGSVSYVYDIANRLTTVGGVSYTWSDNGNLLSDGVSTYTYDHANRLSSAVEGTTTSTFAYNGLGDRLRQTLDGTPTNYTLDLAAGLTEVLSDGANAYLYGNGRLAEEQAAGWVYHLGDALGSVRQLADSSASVALAQSYEPFGETLTSAGTRTSNFQFTNEQTDATGLVYLRTRYYEPSVGRLLSRDVWEGNPNQPVSYNAWLYVHSNPTNWTDPTGRQPCEEGECADPLEYYNLTGWLARAMSANASSAEVARIRTLNDLAAPFLWAAAWATLDALVGQLRGAGGLDFGCLVDTIEGSLREDTYRDQAYDAWIRLSGPEARWDFKRQMVGLLRGDHVQFCGQTRAPACLWLDTDVPGNVHYGYVGRAAGFPAVELHVAAGAAQQRGDYPEFGRWYSYFDDPMDLAAVQVGIQLFQNARPSSLLPAALGNLLLMHRASLRPAERPSPPYVQYPYPQEARWGTQYPIWFFDSREGR